MSKYSKAKKHKCISCYKNVPIGYLSKTSEGWLCNRCQSIINKIKKSTKKSQKSQLEARLKPNVELRFCPRCKINKSIEEFQQAKSGMNFWCSQCYREYGRAYRRRPGQKEKNAAYMRKYMRKYRARAKQVGHLDHPADSTIDQPPEYP